MNVETPAQARAEYMAGIRSGYANAGETPLSTNLRYAFATVRRHLWMALAIVLAVSALTFVWTWLQTPQYFATSTIQINDQGDEVLGEEFEGSAPSLSDWDVDRFLNTQLELLQSKTLALRVASSLDLGQDERFYAAVGLEPGPEGSGFEGSTDAAASLLRARLEVELPRSTRVARITFSSTDAELSARIANAYAEEFIKESLERLFQSSAYARDFVAEQLEESRVALEESERDLNDYAKSVGIIRTRDVLSGDARQSAAGTVTAASLLQLNDAANKARADRIQAESTWEAVRNTPPLSSRPVLGNPTVQSLMTRKAQLESELQTAEERYFEGHPTLVRLRSELAATSAQLNQAATNVRNAIQSEYRAALSAERSLDEQVRRLRGETLSEQDQSVRYNTLARQADTAREIYEGLLQRYRELNASAGIAASNISIIDRAEAPTYPSSPRPMRNLAIGFLLGLALAGLAVFLRDQLDDVIHVPEDVEDKLDLSLLGVVPRAESGNPMEELDDPKSPIAEAYNSLRGALLYSTAAGLPGILVVTSAQATEGKSTSSMAIAKGFGRMKMRALLIDADLRRPAIHKMTGAKMDVGLSDVLTGQAELEQAVQHVEEDGFFVVPAGPLPPSPSELLSSPRMAQVLEQASQDYDVVIVDSPPVLGLADAPILAAIADGTVFVVEAERGRSGQLKTALRRLRSMKPVLLGAVLAKFDPARSGNRYSAYYGYEYYKYSGSERAGT